jgi:LysR family transcriptional activator of dmlA
VAAGLREGKLERVLPDYSQEADVWGVYPTRLARSPKVRLFVGLLVEHFEELGSAQA